MLARSPRRRRLPILLATALVAGCASHIPYHDTSLDHRSLESYLSFLRPGASRATVEARLGPPPSVFEDGRVVAYRLWEIRDTVRIFGEHFLVPATEQKVTYRTACEASFGRCESELIQVMIEFGADGRVLRSSTIAPRQFSPSR